jgi:hypothetical protein
LKKAGKSLKNKILNEFSINQNAIGKWHSMTLIYLAVLCLVEFFKLNFIDRSDR